MPAQAIFHRRQASGFPGWASSQAEVKAVIQQGVGMPCTAREHPGVLGPGQASPEVQGGRVWSLYEQRPHSAVLG